MLSKRALATYKFIQKFIARHHYSPTLSEIAKGIGITSNGVIHRYLKQLEREHLLRCVPGQKRNIQLHHAPIENATWGLPIIGHIAAGQPILAAEHVTYFDFATWGKPHYFILQVKGDSMIGDHICNGDYIICEACDTASPHEISVVLINNEEATLKRVRRNTDGTVELISSNPQLAVQCYPASQIRIQGIYKGLVRTKA